MAGFSVGYNLSNMSLADPLLPRRKKSMLGCAVLFGVLVFAFTYLLLSPYISVTKTKSQLPESLLEDEVIASCISHTRFPEVCISSLLSSSALKRTKRDVRALGMAKLATNKAVLGAHRLYSLPSALKSNVSKVDITTKVVLSDCEDVFDRSFDLLTFALHDLGNLDHTLSTRKVNDIRTWLSASLAFHTTCTDELSSLENTTLFTLKRDADHIAKLISNALAFVTSLCAATVFENDNTDFSSWTFPLQNRPVLHGKTQHLHPTWLSDEDLAMLNAITPTPNVIVAADGTGTYKTVQAAVNAAPQKSSMRYVIYIKKGVYNEQVNVPNTATNLMFVGDGIGATIITGSKNVQQPGVTTFTSATVAINGAGFLARDISFRNTAGAINHQAVALRVSADKTAFFRCSMEAFQDTLYAHTLRQFYRECNIYGTVDFIFGDSAAVFQKCNLFARVPLQGQQNIVTAQGRTDPNSNTGLAFQSCTVDGTPDLVKVIGQYPTYLGRPWKEYSRTVFLKSYETAIIRPEGWLPWSGDFALKTLFYGEYLCTGPGAAASKRVSWSTQISSAQVANQFNLPNFIDGTNWLPSTSFPYDAAL